MNIYLHGTSFVFYLRTDRENPIYPRHRGHSSLDNVDYPAYSHKGPCEHSQIANESYHITQVDFLENYFTSGEKNDQGSTQASDEHDKRKEQCSNFCQGHISLHVFLVDFGELLYFPFLLDKCSNFSYAG